MSYQHARDSFGAGGGTIDLGLGYMNASGTSHTGYVTLQYQSIKNLFK